MKESGLTIVICESNLRFETCVFLPTFATLAVTVHIGQLANTHSSNVLSLSHSEHHITSNCEGRTQN